MLPDSLILEGGVDTRIDLELDYHGVWTLTMDGVPRLQINNMAMDSLVDEIVYQELAVSESDAEKLADERAEEAREEAESDFEDRCSNCERIDPEYAHEYCCNGCEYFSPDEAVLHDDVVDFIKHTLIPHWPDVKHLNVEGLKSWIADNVCFIPERRLGG